MAENSLYISRMLTDLTNKMASMEAAMKEQTVAIGNINDVVGQSVLTLNIVKSDTVRLQIPGTNLGTGQGGQTFTASYKVKATGSVNIACDLFANAGYDSGTSRMVTSTFSYSIGGSSGEIGRIESSAQNPNVTGHFVKSVMVNDGDVLTIKVVRTTYANNTSSGTAGMSAAFISYDLVDIVNEGAFIPV